jgi:hypothetical protein
MLDKENSDVKNQKARYALIHALHWTLGALLAYSLSMTPLAYLGLQRPLWVNAVATGLFVSFGGGLFNDALGAIQEFKRTQEQVRTQAASGAAGAKPIELPPIKRDVAPAA